MNRFLIYATLILFLVGCAGNPWPGSLAACAQGSARELGQADRPGVTSLKKGMRALAKEKYAESIALLQRSLSHLESDSERAVAYNGIGIACYKLGKEKDALEAFEAATAANPAAVEPFYNMGIVSLKTGNEDKAVVCFEKAALLNQEAGPPVSACPSSASPPATLCVALRAGELRPGSPDMDTRALEFLAVIYSQRQQWDDARRILTEAQKLSPQTSRILTALALIELKASNTNQALEYLQKALEQDQHYAPAIYNLAVINQRLLHKNDQALPLFVEYTRLAPAGQRRDQTRALIKEIKTGPATGPVATNVAGLVKTVPPPPPPPKTGIATAENRATAQATNAAQTVSALPSFEELMEVAKKLEQQGRREAAFNNYLRIARAAERANKMNIKNQALKHATSLADGNAQAAYDLGNYFLERNKKEDAFLYYKAAAEQNTHPYFSNMALARLALEKDDYDAAIVSLKKADAIRAEDPEALLLLAELYDQRLGMTNAAEQTYVQFIKRYPGDRRTTDVQNRLKAINPEYKPPENSNNDKPAKPRSFWQRMYKKSDTNKTN